MEITRVPPSLTMLDLGPLRLARSHMPGKWWSITVFIHLPRGAAWGCNWSPGLSRRPLNVRYWRPAGEL